MAAANYVDPKLFSVLTFQDIFDDKYADNNIMERYTAEVLPLVEEYRKNIDFHINQYLLNFINDVHILMDVTGYNANTSESTGSFDSMSEISHIDYIPSLEIEPIWNAVMDLRYKYSYTPYWLRNGYTLYGNNETVIVKNSPTPKKFIEINRESFNRSFGDTNLGKLERAVTIKNSTFDYPIYVPALTQYEDRAIPASYEEAVRRHLILKTAMDNKIQGTIFSSKIDKDGNVELIDLEDQ